MTCVRYRNTLRCRADRATIATSKLLAAAIVIAVALPAMPARTASAGGVVTAGAGSIRQDGVTTTITQAASPTQQPARMVIDWNSFSSTAGELIVFNQPNATAIAFNRVTGANPSLLLGNLSANGQVFDQNNAAPPDANCPSADHSRPGDMHLALGCSPRPKLT
jgi:large exoprotein involved in heme utilization and adhesion